MAALGADSAAGRRWHALRDLPNRMSLRTKLITGLLALVIAAVAAISISSVWVLRSYLTSQDDNQLRATSSNTASGITSSVANGQPVPIVPGQTYWVQHTSNL